MWRPPRPLSIERPNGFLDAPPPLGFRKLHPRRPEVCDFLRPLLRILKRSQRRIPRDSSRILKGFLRDSQGFPEGLIMDSLGFRRDSSRILKGFLKDSEGIPKGSSKDT
jgi:hypothetical protein